MSGRFVRASKYRHVHGDAARKDKCYTNVKPLTAGDGDGIKANSKFIAYAATGGGGPLVVHNRDKIGPLGHSPPTINVHKSKVLEWNFSPFQDNVIATASDDCFAAVTMFPEDGLTEHVTEASVTLGGSTPHTKKVTLLEFNPTANNIIATAGHDNQVKVWDLQNAGAAAFSYDGPSTPHSLVWNCSAKESLLALTFADHSVHVYDPRQAGSAMNTQGCAGGKQSRAVWLTNIDKLCVVGFSKTSMRQYLLFDPRNFDKPMSVGDIDQSAGVLMPFYDPDNCVLYLGGRGDANIKYFEVTDEAPYLHFLSEFRHTESHKGIGWVPKKALDVTNCEIALCLRLMRDYIMPVSFQVPRKSDVFQADIYPDTYAGIPSIDSAEWVSGQNAGPKLTSMNPTESKSADSSKSAPVSFKAGPTVHELKAELEVANKRIKELEELVAQLRTDAK